MLLFMRLLQMAASLVSVVAIGTGVVRAECVTIQLPARRTAPKEPATFRVSRAFCGQAFAGAGFPGARLEAVPNARITLLRSGDGDDVAYATTDGEGNFTFAHVPLGTYRVYLPGFTGTGQVVEITSANQDTCQRKLFISFILSGECSPGSPISTTRPQNVGPDPAENLERDRARSQASTELNAGVRMRDNLSGAEQHFREAIRIDPTFWLPHVNLAMLLEERQQLAAAEAEYREAARLGPESEIAYWKLTTFLIDHGRAADAQTALRVAERRVDSSAGVSAGLGLVAFTKHKWKEAENHLWQALELPPKDALFGFGNDMQWFTLVTIAILNQGRSTEAREHETLVLNAWGNDPWVLNMFGWALLERGERLEDASAMFQRAVNAEPENAAYLDNLGRANFKLGRFDLAEEHLKEAVERSKERPAMLEHLAEVYAVTGRRDEARETLTAAIARTDNAADRKRLVKRLEQLK